MKSFLTAGLLISLFTSALFAADASNQPADTNNLTADTNQPTSGEGIHRWLDLNALSLSFRYRNQASNSGYHYFDNGQQRSLIDGAFKLDAAGKYAVHFRVSSGRTFNWAYSTVTAPNFGERLPLAFGYSSPQMLAKIYQAAYVDPAAFAHDSTIPSRGWQMYFRQLYFSAAPVKQVAFEYGSLNIEKGEGTEATTYDDDGYIAGERIRLFDPKHLFFDQIAATFAYEGDIQQPNFFARGERLGQSNYHQILVTKHFGKRLRTSADYTFDKGTHTVREAALLRLPEARVIDSVRGESYQRVNDRTLLGETFYAHQGLAVTGTKTFNKKFQLDGGFANIDQDYGVLVGDRLAAVAGFSMNGDAFLTGTRVFTRANWKITPMVSLFGYYTHTVTDAPADVVQLNKQSFNMGGIIDFKSLLTHFHVL